MKSGIWILFSGLLIALALAEVAPKEDYLPPALEEEQVAAEQPIENSAALADDGYRYKTIKKLRHRRDVSEILAPSAESAVLADDGYHYKAPESAEQLEKVANEYLPPNEEASEVKEATEAPEISSAYLPPAEEATDIKEVPVSTEAPIILDTPIAEAEQAPELAEPAEVSNEYLPPADDSEVIEGPVESAVLADDGYHYRRIRYRRDVSEIAPASNGYLYEAPAAAEKVANVYLPPAEVKEAEENPSEAPEIANEYLPPVADVKEAPEVIEAPAESAQLAEDGYRYKTIRRLKYRHRRDVSEIVAAPKGYLYEAPAATEEVANVYLPPVEVKEAVPEVTEVPEFPEVPEVANEYLPPVAEVKEAPEVVEAPAETAQLAEDGYRYKTIRRLKYRHRRDVSEIVAAPKGYLYEAPVATEEVANVYLPPAEVKEAVPEVTEAPEVPEVPEVANEYLPPVAEAKEAPEVVEAPAETAVLAEDGYRYKTVRKLKYRHRRDVSEIVAPQKGYLYEAPAATDEVANVYLPPAEVKEAVPEVTEAPEVPEIPEIANEYLPPVAEVKEAPEVVEAPAEPAELAEDGYRYKTVRRLKYRHRRDVSEIVAPPKGYLYEAPAATDEVANVYLPPAEVKEAVPEVTEAPEVPEVPEVANEYLPPVAEAKEAPEVVEAPAETAVLAEDGYRYKTVRRLKYRHRRDVSEIVAPPKGYLYEAPAATDEVANVYLPPAEVKEAVPEVTEVPEVPEVPEVANEYLPPVAEVKEAPEVVEGPAETAQLAEDGYRYKTIRKLKYRHRRDVSEIVASPKGYLYEAPVATEEVANIYLPPAEIKEAVPEVTEVPEVPEVQEVANEYLPPVAEVKEAPEVVEAPAETAELAEDGYRYKTVRRLKYRHRRDVSEIATPFNGYTYEAPAATDEVANIYLPPAEVKQVIPETTEAPEIPQVPEVSNEYLPPDAEVKEELAEDGYRYKTVRRLKYRHRRDVSELVAPIVESAVLAEDGYHYKAPEASDVQPKVSNEYLPPQEEVAELKEASELPEVSEAPVPTEAPAASEAPKVSNEYLPPTEDVPEPKVASEAPEESAVLADDGYHYKVGKRFRFRRDVSEIAAAQNDQDGYSYPSPVKAAVEVPVAPEEDSAILADDGYRYKTVRRIKYRHRRDVSELVAPVEESAVLAEDGYHYKKPENELSIPKIANEYLPPVEQAAEVNQAPEASDAEIVEVAPEVVEVPEIPISNEYLPPAEEPKISPESAALADDGYRYKTVRRIRYRHRRDVSEVVSASSNGYIYEAPATSEPIASEPIANEYLPPVEEAAEVKEAIPEPTEAAPIVSNEYLPPAEESRADSEVVEAPQESAALAEDGYRYRTVRRIKYRQRRDVSEIAAPTEDGYAYNAPVEAEPKAEYLPPAAAVAQVKEIEESPEASSVLAEDGYRYKTVRRLRYRHRV